jgi:hypothetical protein
MSREGLRGVSGLGWWFQLSPGQGFNNLYIFAIEKKAHTHTHTHTQRERERERERERDV